MASSKTTPAKAAPAKARRRSKTGASARKPRILGVTHDGVEILDPGPGKQFTRKELRAAIRAVLAQRRD